MEKLSHLSQALAAFAALSTLWIAYGFIRERPVLTPAPARASRDLHPILVQRFDDLEVAAAYQRRVAPSAVRLFIYWNNAGKYLFGATPSSRLYYTAEARPGFESDFEQLVHGGLEGIKLFILSPSAKWSDQHVELLTYKWAAECGVRRDWIASWSTFRDHVSAEPRNLCASQGTCLVISEDCHGSAFTEFSPVQ